MWNKKAEITAYTTGILLIVLLIFVIPIIIFSSQNVSASSPNSWIMNGSDVYTDDPNVYISVSPAYSNNPVISLISKVYSGNIDIVVGFNTTQVTPTSAKANPHKVNVTKSYTCDGEGKFFNYTTNPNHFWCYFQNETDTIPIFEHNFDSGNLASKTAYWNETEIQWTDVSGAFNSLDYNFNGFNKWYYKTGININSNQLYQLKLNLQPAPGVSSEKYFFGVKPSSETLQEAIVNGHFYYIDPWTADLTAGLVSFYKMNESSGSVIDYLSGYNGVNNGATPSGSDYYFDGASSYIELGTNSTFNYTGSDNYTISAWVNLSYGGGTGTHFILARDTNGASSNQVYAFGIKNNKTYGELNGGHSKVFNGNITLQEGVYTNIIYVINGTNMTVWVNGSLDGYVTYSSPVPPAAVDTPADLGRRAYPGAESYFNGSIKWVGVWNVSLNDSMIGKVSTGVTYPNDAIPPTVNLISPSNSSHSSILTQYFVANATDDSGLSDATLYIWNSTGLSNTQSCYQESANVSNQTGIDGSCGLNYSGNYIALGPILYYLDGNINDGAWNLSSVQGTYLINYTKPAYRLINASWKIGWINLTTSTLVNHTTSIPDDCLDYNTNKVLLKVQNDSFVVSSSMTAYCYNGTWKSIDSFVSGPVGTLITDEAMNWSVLPTQSISGLSNQTNITYTFPSSSVGKTFYWNIYACDTSGSCAFNATNYTFNLNTCGYSGSGNWYIAASDNCNITTNINLGGNNLYVSGSGTLTINGGNISNFAYGMANQSSIIRCINNGCLRLS